MSCFVMSFQTQLASVMEILVKAAISEETEWRTERAYGAIGCTHIASRRSVGVQVHDGEVMTGGGMLAAEEEGFLGEDWNCSLWKPMTRRHSNMAKPESHSGFTLERAEVERIVIKEESAELEEQAVGQGCVSQQQQESHRFARKRSVESQAAVDRGVAGRGSETQCCEGGWGFNQRGGGGGVCEGPGGLYEPDTNLEQEEDHTLEAELDFMMAPAVGGAWQHKPACAVEQLHLITPPAKDKVPPGSKVAWNTPASPYSEGGEGEGEGEGGQQHWQNQQQCGGSFHSPCLTYPSEPSTPARFPSAECQEQETPAATRQLPPTSSQPEQRHQRRWPQQVWPVWQDLQHAMDPEDSPAHPHWREAVQLHRLWQVFSEPGQPEDSPAGSHWGETVRLPPVRKEVQPPAQPENAPADSHRGETVQLLRVRPDFWSPTKPGNPPAHTYWRKTVLVYPLREEF
ncbi:hypothetical protein SKAU_G00032180 [Synaphobranchus kaupii]|uniref:Uncharacterized protein n=1 Tax=Synaphobranchus kaupii TaxID=118154 RepID=A0A9Q1JF91_SYNKA|nr:hypothetical protein SKAU_G00032180 [Synaphobranchus kaupii]